MLKGVPLSVNTQLPSLTWSLAPSHTSGWEPACVVMIAAK